MDRFDRIYQLHHILSGRRTPIANKVLQERLECSEATVKRLIEATVKRLINVMRDHFDAPIVYDRQLNAYDNENNPAVILETDCLPMFTMAKGCRHI